MSQKKSIGNRYGERAGDFIRSAAVLCETPHDGWLPSACLLLGFACELLAKKRLVHEVEREEDLRYKPYGHDISGMWRDKTDLFAEAESLVAELKKKPNPNGVDVQFDWALHFDQLARGHSRDGNYSLRYHQGEICFPNPKAVTVVLGNIWNAEQRTGPK